jgi:hypothetical protein
MTTRSHGLQFVRTRLIVAATLLLAFAATSTSGSHPKNGTRGGGEILANDETASGRSSLQLAAGTTPTFAWPASVSADNRRFVDQKGDAYLLKTMSSWAMAQNCTNAEITKALGFNAVTVSPFGVHMNDSFGDRYKNKAGQRSVDGMGVQRTCATARLPGTGNELLPRLTAREKRFGLRDSSDSILVQQLPGAGCRRRSRLVPPQARPCCARPVPHRSRSPRTAMIRRGVVSRTLCEMGQPRSQHAVLGLSFLPSPLCRTPPMDGAPQGQVQPLATGNVPPART